MSHAFLTQGKSREPKFWV